VPAVGERNGIVGLPPASAIDPPVSFASTIQRPAADVAFDAQLARYRLVRRLRLVLATLAGTAGSAGTAGTVTRRHSTITSLPEESVYQTLMS
jgi:hypothetical protein